MSDKPKVVTLCGSTRFKEAFEQANRDLTLQGIIVISVGLFGHQEAMDMNGPVKQMLDELHLRKIDISDGIFVVNPGGYLGSSTLNEIRYARQANKNISWLEEGWFWSRVELTDKDQCWRWNGSRLPSGYGTCRHDKAGGYAHRFSFEHATGVAAGEMYVLHQCDNPSCVNPDHLFLGTQAENMQDMWNKGRGKHPVLKGEENGRAKLTAEDVEEIRSRYSAGQTTYRLLASEFGVHYSLIAYIIKGKLWKSE